MEPKDSDQWQQCPSGTLAGVAQDVKNRQRRELLRRVGSIAIPVMLIAIGVGYWQSTSDQLTCPEAYGMLGKYINGQLDERQASAVERHLAGCEKCSRAYEAMKKQIDASRVQTVANTFRAELNQNSQPEIEQLALGYRR